MQRLSPFNFSPLEQHSRIKILDISFDKVTKEEALKMVLEKLSSRDQKNSHPFFIATPNPEMLLEANKNEPFKKILNGTDLNIADGSGILLASRFLKTPLPERVTGVDFMQKICENSPKGTKIFLLGAAEGIAEKVQQKLEEKNPEIHIVGTYSGSPAPGLEQNICTTINNSGADVLFVAFGAPKQELWLARNLPFLPNIKIAMGVGGAFDFIAGVRKRAPVWMQKLWLEWLYRLIQEPKRIKRIFNATVRFPIKLILSSKKLQ